MLSSTYDEDGVILGRYRRKKKADTKSSQIVSALKTLFPGMQTEGFSKAIAALVPNDEDVQQCAVGLMPDAFAIHEDTREVDLIEVVDTSPIHLKKAERIADLSEALSDYDWTLGVVCFDGAGNLTSHLPGVFYHPIYREFDGDANNATPRALAASKL